MIAGALLVLSLTHDGHCLGGHTCDVEASWAAEIAAAPAVFSWQLQFAQTVIADGQVLLLGDRPVRIALKLPVVRARTSLVLTYQLRRTQTPAVLEQGRRVLTVYPDDAWEGLSDRLAASRVRFYGGAGDLTRALVDAGISVRCLGTPEALTLQTADILLVGPDQCRRASDEAAILRCAATGGSVFLFAQSRCGALAGYDLSPRRITGDIYWCIDHPVFDGLSAADLADWLSADGQSAVAMELPPNAPALPLAYWRPIASNVFDAPVDALIVEMQIGQGRLLFCQVAAIATLDDPRSRMVLSRVLDYLQTRPGPSPALPGGRSVSSRVSHADATSRVTGVQP